MNDVFMDENERRCCAEWIDKYLKEHATKQADSYVMKHMFQHMTGIYSGDKEFQEMMRECGHDSVTGHDSVFNVRIDSVVIKNYYK